MLHKLTSKLAICKTVAKWLEKILLKIIRFVNHTAKVAAKNAVAYFFTKI